MVSLENESAEATSRLYLLGVMFKRSNERSSLFQIAFTSPVQFQIIIMQIYFMCSDWFLSGLDSL